MATISSADEINTVVSISPMNQRISPGQSFSFDIICDTSVPVKSFELSFNFDPTLIHVSSINEGDFFSGYSTFFNKSSESSNGTIDNDDGEVTDVFNLILGLGNVTTEGSLITVNCVALDSIGQSSLDLVNVGATDETTYLPLATVDGSISVQDQILLYNADPSEGTENVSIGRNSLFIDIEHLSSETFNYSISTNPDIGTSSASFQNNGTKTCSISNLAYDTTYQWTVSIQDNATGEWLNKSFWFTTESEPDANGGGSESPGGGGGSGGFFPPPPVEDENNPPVTPVKPSGPLYIEPGGVFSYSAQTYDPDGDLIRYRFRWDDGNISEWTDLYLSNRTVTVSHSWFQIENFSIQVIAQDEHGLNSSWSEGLLVFSSFSEDNSSNETVLPVANFSSMKPDEHNMTFSFDGSNSYDEDGEIVSYFWDFGDGSTATGLNPNHTYDEPGWYNVTLVVTDNEGNMYSKTMSVFVASSVDESESIDNTADESTFPWLFLLIISGAAVIVVVLFGKKIFYRFFEIVEVDDQDPSSVESSGIGETFVDQLKKIDGGIQPFFSRSDKPFDTPSGLQADSIDHLTDEDTTDPYLVDKEPLKQEPDESRSDDTADQPEIHRIRDLIDKKFFKDNKK